MIYQRVVIAPDLATKWLEHNKLNRSMRDSVVDRYARDMAAGKWRLTHQGIAIDKNGEVIDGQHRLWAIIKANVAVAMMVARDVEPDTRGNVDSGIIRTDIDHMRLGYGLFDITKMHTAIAKRLLSARLGSSKATTDELVLCIATHRKAIDFAVAAFPRVVRGVTTSPVQTVIARAFYSSSHEQIQHFCEGLCDGRMTDTSDEPVLLLRNYLLERAPRAHASVAELVYAKTERALMAFLRRERIAMLYPAANELFPLPEEQTQRRRMHVKTAENGMQTVTTGRKLPGAKAGKKR